MKSKITTALSLIYLLTACGTQNAPQVTSLGATDVPSTTNSPSSGSTSTSTTTPANPNSKPGNIALVFSGNGACPEGCAQAGSDAATAAGLTPKLVTGNEISSTSTQAEIDAFFLNVRVWIMPGGVSNTEIASMSSTMQTALTHFVSQGGGYVGWCAGAFAATGIIGTTSQDGLGLFPADTLLYTDHSATNSYGASIEKLSWNGTTRYLYWEGGPYISNLGPTAETIATYPDGTVAAARAPYGSGRVFISGVHPEAPTWWWQGTSITDPDGSDLSYAADMIKWAASME